MSFSPLGPRTDRGEISDDQVRRLSIEALVDSGATFFCLPKSLIQQLGLKFYRMGGGPGASSNRLFASALR